jgi:hypothetical protein
LTAAVVLATVLLAPATSGGATASSTCETWTRDSTAAPALVREWFASSTDQRVRVCPQPATAGAESAAPLYFGEGSVTRRSAVCSYLSHGLKLTGSGPTAQLQRYDRTEALAMALADADCPPPGAAAGPHAYVETYDVSAAAFAGIMRLWSTACGTGAAAATCERRPATLDPDRMRAATVTRIVRIPGSLVRRRYALFIEAPQPPAGGASRYVVYVDKHVRGPYQISAFAETN